MNVIIIDDDRIILTLHKLLVMKSKLGEDPVCFSNGLDALEYIRNEYKDDPTLVLLDINMPLLNGWEFLDEINGNANYKDIFVIMVTSSIDNSDKEKSKSYSNIIGFIEKPVNQKTLQDISEMPELSPHL